MGNNCIVNAEDCGRCVDPKYPMNVIDYIFINRCLNSIDIYTSITEALMMLSFNGEWSRFDCFRFGQRGVAYSCFWRWEAGCG